MTGITTFTHFTRTLDLLCGQNRVPFEVRTTVHDALLDENDVLAIAADLARRGYHGKLAVQQAVAELDRPLLTPLPPLRHKFDSELLTARSALTLEFR